TRGETRSGDVIITGATGGAQGSAPLFYPAFCGDGVVETLIPRSDGSTFNETCDPPGVNGCRADCTFCGDGIVESGGVCTTQNTKLQTTCAQDADCTDRFCSQGAFQLLRDKCQVDTDCDTGACVGGLFDNSDCSVRNG